ncbi:MAG: DUF687 family protein [Verrucomicrobia bacterium]|nr:DUF687 family protein [Verrucomicrobiota bacterium]
MGSLLSWFPRTGEVLKYVASQTFGLAAAAIFSDPKDHEIVTLTYPNWSQEHPLSALFKKSLAPYTPKREEEALALLKKLSPTLQDQVNDAWGNRTTDKQAKWAQLTPAIRRVVSKILNNDPNPDAIYGAIYALADKPTTDDLNWGKNHAMEDTARLIQAMHAHHRLSPDEKISQFSVDICSGMEKNLHDHTHTFQLNWGRKEVSQGKIGYINGMNFTKQDAENNAGTISWHCADNHALECVYSPTQGKMIDRMNALIQISGSTLNPATKELLQNWIRFFYTHPTERYLQIAYSRGALETYNALQLLPQELRDRIIVIAIAPARNIPGKFAHKVYNLCLEGDPIKAFSYQGINAWKREPKEDITLSIKKCAPHLEEEDSEIGGRHNPHHAAMRKVVSEIIDSYLKTNDCPDPSVIKQKYKVSFSLAQVFPFTAAILSAIASLFRFKKKRKAPPLLPVTAPTA